MNNTLEGINSRMTEAEETNDMEDRMVKITATEQNIEKRMKKMRQPNPLQYSGLENSMDCIVHGVTKTRTQLGTFTFKRPVGQQAMH